MLTVIVMGNTVAAHISLPFSISMIPIAAETGVRHGLNSHLYPHGVR